MERGILLAQADECLYHAVLIVLGLRLNRHRYDRLRKLDRLQEHGLALGTKSVTGERILEAHRSGDIAGLDIIDILATIGVHAQDASQTLPPAAGAVQHRAALFHRAGVDTEVNETANVRVSDDLKGEGGERLIIFGVPFQQFARLGVSPRDGRNVCG